MERRSLTAALHCQLVKKVFTGFFDCASPAKHFAQGKMLLRPKSLDFSGFSVAGYCITRRVLTPSCSHATLFILI